MYFLLITLTLLLSFFTANAVPAWQGSFLSSDTFGSLVPGATYIEAISPSNPNKHHGRSIRHLSPTGDVGVESNVTAFPNPRPPLYYIHRNQLWQSINETTIMAVNIINSTNTFHIPPEEHPTTPKPIPLRVTLGKKQEGVKGIWRWRGTLLYFEFLGGGTNYGLFYSCGDAQGVFGLYIFAQMTSTPKACEMLTLHGGTSEVNER